MSIFYDAVCEDFVSFVYSCDWIGSIGAIIGFIMGIGG